MILQHLVFVSLGLIALYYGADWLVKGASRLANTMGIPPLIIGLTIVSIGTSMPELLVSMTAALNKNSEIAVGNVVGSNIANIGLILGIAGLITPIAIHSQLVRREIPLMIGVSFIVFLMALDKNISRLDGLVLFIGMVGFTAFSYVISQRESRTIKAEAAAFDLEEGLLAMSNPLLEFGRIVLGIGVLLLGARLLVDGAVGLAETLGVSKAVIGFTLVAIGTSLPELATSVMAALKKENDIAVGNIVGSNLANLLLILGVVALVQPIPVDIGITRFEMPIMLGFAVILLPFSLDLILQRKQALIFLSAYIVFCVVLFV